VEVEDTKRDRYYGTPICLEVDQWKPVGNAMEASDRLGANGFS